MERSKETIATDIDEVLFPLVAEFVKWHNREYGTTLTSDDFTSYEFEQVLQESIPEVVHRIRLFLDQEHGHLHVEPIFEAQEALETLSEDYDIIAVTARHPEFKLSTYAYLQHHFGEIIEELNLLGHKETIDIIQSKAEVCQKLGVSALIDDSLEHVLGCVGSGVQGVLFGQYPWNQQEDLPESVIVCPTWKDVLDYAYAKA
ncbi:hypothetical protein A3F64_00560 [Candidatus Saccharibacteria bacterium RIFCSPHIGHO2_12_FULL_42_8]|nr:MAG: hypothetical protein A3F64_00560 [Candidatus Saccharibacteria bacterium RIFCSPHIGHO2_12_FULL_42_8]